MDADLGGGVLKLRIARPGEGRRDGFRTIVACIIDQRAFFLFGYAKNEMGNISLIALTTFRDTAEYLQGLDEQELEDALARGAAVEIRR